MIIKIPSTEWQRIKEMQKRQDYHAFALGQLRWEFLKNRATLLDVAGTPNLEKLGALHWEYDQKEVFWYGKIKETEDRQRAMGEQALRAAGVNTKQGDYTIQDGVVFALQKGTWVPFDKG
jgi:hypothetical protein